LHTKRPGAASSFKKKLAFLSQEATISATSEEQMLNRYQSGFIIEQASTTVEHGTNSF